MRMMIIFCKPCQQLHLFDVKVQLLPDCCWQVQGSVQLLHHGDVCWGQLRQLAVFQGDFPGLKSLLKVKEHPHLQLKVGLSETASLFLHNHLVGLGLTKVDHVPPPSPCLEVVFPVHPVVVVELPWIGWNTETQNDDVKLPQHRPAATGPGSLLKDLVPFSVVLNDLSPTFGRNHCHLEKAKVAAGLLEGLLSQLEIKKRLHSPGDISVEQHAEVDDVASKCTGHVNSSNHILPLLADPPDPLLGVVDMLERHVDIAGPVLQLLSMKSVEGKEGGQLGGLRIEDGGLLVSLLKDCNLLILQVDSKWHHWRAASVHVKPVDAGHSLVGRDDAVVDVLLHLVGRLIVHLKIVCSPSTH